MMQLKCFTVSTNDRGSIGEVIVNAVNPFLRENSGTEIESVDINMAGSFHKAVVLVSYQVEDPKTAEEEPQKRAYKKSSEK